MNNFKTVLLKECRDNLRDRRTLISSLALALGGPILFVGLMTFVLNTAFGKADDPLPLTVVGSDNAPQLVAYLVTQNAEVTKADSIDPEQSVRNDEHDLILVIPEDYADQFKQGALIALPLVYDSSDIGGATRDYVRARNLIDAYSRTVGFLRLQLRGIDPIVARPLTSLEVDIASPAARALSILATLPYLLILVVFMGGFYLAIDTTAGEREQGSLEPLLTQPITRQALVMGKIAATCVFAGMALAVFLVGFSAAIPMVPFHKIGMSLDIDVVTCLAIFAIATPLILFAASLLTVVASFAKSYKEAQTYLTLVILVPTLPLIITQLTNVKTSWWLMLIPSQSQSSLISELIAGKPIVFGYVVLSFVATTLFAALLAWLAVHMYRREGILG